MRWKDLRRSKNVEDRRGHSGGGGGRGIGGGAGIGLLLGLLRSKMGIAVIIGIVAFSYFTGTNPLSLLASLDGSGGQVSQQPSTPAPANDETAQFVAAVLGSTEDVWTQVFRSGGAQYRAPKLVLFTDRVQSACGVNSSATGPFYCPGDEQVYMDLGFFRQLQALGAPGDFAQAYVIGHEVGHHIQKITGTEARVRQAQRASGSQAEANQWLVKLELQADCYAGVWAHHANKQHKVLEPGDVEEGLQAARSIGDDTLQRRAGQAVRHEKFTHGSSAQRQQWLQTGLRTGDVESCNTF